MVTVYVWNYLGPKHVGHASMKCGSTYISWWPAKDRFGWFEKVAPLMGRTFEEDKGDKHKSPNRTIHLGRLDETAIKNWWRRVGLSWNGQQIQGPPHVPYILHVLRY